MKPLASSPPPVPFPQAPSTSRLAQRSPTSGSSTFRRAPAPAEISRRFSRCEASSKQREPTALPSPSAWPRPAPRTCGCHNLPSRIRSHSCPQGGCAAYPPTLTASYPLLLPSLAAGDPAGSLNGAGTPRTGRLRNGPSTDIHPVSVRIRAGCGATPRRPARSARSRRLSSPAQWVRAHPGTPRRTQGHPVHPDAPSAPSAPAALPFPPQIRPWDAPSQSTLSPPLPSPLRSTLIRPLPLHLNRRNLQHRRAAKPARRGEQGLRGLLAREKKRLTYSLGETLMNDLCVLCRWFLSGH